MTLASRLPFSIAFGDKRVNGTRIELSLPSEETIDLLSWLKAHPLFPKLYWEERTLKCAIAAVGAAVSLDGPPTQIKGDRVRCFGGSDFCARRHATWGNFPTKRYFLPLIELIKGEEGLSLALNNILGQQEVPPLQLAIREESKQPINPPLKRCDAPTFLRWQHLINRQLKAIDQGLLKKVVLARLTSFTFKAPPSPYCFLRSLKGEVRFAFAFSKEQMLIGATPEKLYSRKGRKITTSAIAGTRRRGKNAREDLSLKKELIQSDKEGHEHLIVEEFISKALASLCEEVTQARREIVKTAKVQHLSRSFAGTLRKGVYEKELLKALHPTPALGGAPRNEALEAIMASEPFDRGWYGAPVGWVSKTSASFAVAIRSALINKRSLHLFGGAGIVSASHPASEWEEIDHKISQFFLWEE